MSASVNFLSSLVSVALFVTVVSPIVLLILLVRDWKGRKLW